MLKMRRFSSVVLCFRLLYCLPILVVSVNAGCTFSERQFVTVSGGNDNFGATDLDSCKAACEDGCVGILFDGSLAEMFRCKTFNQAPQEGDFQEDSINYEHSSYYTKNCVDDQTTTESTTVTTTSETDSCSVNKVQDKEVTSKPGYTEEVTNSKQTCQFLCQWVVSCTAYSYHTSGTCILHTSTVTMSTVAGYMHATKTTCDNRPCCFTESEGQLGTSTDSRSFSLLAVTDTCEDLCLEVSTCKALTVSGSSCSVFAAQPSVRDEAGSSYYSKSCTGSDPSTAVLTNVCNSAGILQQSKLLGVVAGFVIIFTAMF